MIFCYITFHILVISYSILPESVISISCFVLSDSVISNSKSVISDSYYLFLLYQSPLYQKDHPLTGCKRGRVDLNRKEVICVSTLLARRRAPCLPIVAQTARALLVSCQPLLSLSLSESLSASVLKGFFHVSCIPQRMKRAEGGVTGEREREGEARGLYEYISSQLERRRERKISKDGGRR